MSKKFSNRSILARDTDELKEIAHLGDVYGLVYISNPDDRLLLFLIAEVDESGDYIPGKHDVVARIAVSSADPDWMAISGPDNSDNPALVPFHLIQLVHSLVNDPAEFARFFRTTDTGEA